MSKEIELLTEIRDFLEVMAEPALEKRDEKFRKSISDLAGGGKKKQAAILLMDGSRTKSAISKESGMDDSSVTKLVKALVAKSLIESDQKHPKLRTKLPAKFFDEKGNLDE